MMNGSSNDVTNKDGADEDEAAKPSCLQRASNKIVEPMEKGFYRLGLVIGHHPIRTLLISTLLVVLCAIGFVRFEQTTDPDKLWVPLTSDYFVKKEWISQNFPSKVRFLNVIIVSNNILQPNKLETMNFIYHRSFIQHTPDGYNLSTLCYRPTSSMCMVRGLLELWKFDTDVVNNLTETNIVQAVNDNITRSPLYGTPFEISNYLGGVTYDIYGQIKEAEATFMQWFTVGESGMQTADEPPARLETVLLNFMTQHRFVGTLYAFASRSLGDAAGESIQSDITLLSAGYSLLLIYVMVMLGRNNLVQQRVVLSLCGLLTIGMCIAVSYGLASAMGILYGPMHSILPFLLLGIGIDDMFVICGALSTLTHDEKLLPIPERLALALKHAGMSITVTSLTDIVAFLIGATAVLPALRSFCLYAAIGILGVYMLQCTFFVACLCLDMKRQHNNRDGCLCCITHRNYEPSACSQREIIPQIFRQYFSPNIIKFPVKIVVLVLTAALVGFNTYKFTLLKQDFNPSLFFPPESKAMKYTNAEKKYFPGTGKAAFVYCKDFDYFSNKDKMEQLMSDLEHSPYVNTGTTDSWFWSFTKWLSVSTNPGVNASLNQTTKYPVNHSAFNNLLYQFVHTEPSGIRHRGDLKFSPDNTLIASTLKFTFRIFGSASEEIKAMHGIRDLIGDIGFPGGGCFDFSAAYRSWETNEVIQKILYRNIGMAFGAVFIVTLVLIANIWTSLLVLSCVMFTLLDLAGTMQMWGLDIDAVTCVNTVLAIGLAVDYSAHIGHTFMVYRGTRNDRTKATLDDIGTPVFNGGVSTFLAFILLSASSSYVFQVFFKVFLLVVLYGLWHGLVYLPVILSLIGPSPYMSATRHISDIMNSPTRNKLSPEISASSSENYGFTEDQPNGDIVSREKHSSPKKFAEPNHTEFHGNQGLQMKELQTGNHGNPETSQEDKYTSERQSEQHSVTESENSQKEKFESEDQSGKFVTTISVRL